ncbi:flagellar protein FliT [Gracilibacillus sp. D59]|uniref:flagellar protein FliT n=1 Tax=Gracilibacillus sp. D59 TaxID=3457434 RepID=UPI003FCDFA01
MVRMTRLKEITLKLNQTLDEIRKSANREERIIEIQKLLNEREDLLKEVKKPYTEEELKVGRELITIDRDIQKKMNQIFEGVKVDVRSVRKQKSSNQKYVNPYQNLATNDGTFLDKKK